MLLLVLSHHASLAKRCIALNLPFTKGTLLSLTALKNWCKRVFLLHVGPVGNNLFTFIFGDSSMQHS